MFFEMLVLCSIYDRIELLPKFLLYYDRLGATEFVFSVWNGSANPLFSKIESMCQGFAVHLKTGNMLQTQEYNGRHEAAALDESRMAFQGCYEWYCVADLDEFCYFQGMTLPEAAKEAEASGFSAIQGTLIDRVSSDPILPVIEEQTVLDDALSMAADITRMTGGCCSKIPLARIELPIGEGHHFTEGNPWRNFAEVHHFKWTEGVLERLQERRTAWLAQKRECSLEPKLQSEVLRMFWFRERSEFNFRVGRRLGI